MKKIFLTALLVPAMALAQTFPSPTFSSLTLQNPLSVSSGGTGSAASTGTGSVVLSNSPSLTTPAISSPTVTGAFNATGLVTTSDLASQAANTVLGNATASTASPTAIPVPSCSAGTSALTWTSGSGFSCNTNVTVNYTAGGTGAVTRTSTQRFSDDIHLEDYCSAATLNTSGGDITTCLQNAINALPATGGRCVSLPGLPPGVASWSISSTINIGNGSAGTPSTTNGVCLRGAGAAGFFGSQGTYIAWTGPANGTMISVNGPYNNLQLYDLNLNANNSAGRIFAFNSIRFSTLHNLFLTACTIKCIDTEGLAATQNLNFMLDWSLLYVTTGNPNAIAVNFDGVITTSTDTWLTTIRNSRFESLGAGGIAMRLAFSDNIMFDQLHLVTGTSGGKVVTLTGNITSGSNSVTNASTTTGIQVGEYIDDAGVIGQSIPAGTKITAISGTTVTLSKNATATATGYGLNVYAACGLLLDASSTIAGNTFPTGHQFNKTATDNVCMTYDSTHPLGVNTAYGFGTTDNETVPNSPFYVGVTDIGNTFGGFGGPTASAYTPTFTQNGGTLGVGNSVIGHYALEGAFADVQVNIVIGASGITTPGFSFNVGLPPGIIPSFASSCSGVNLATGTALTVLASGGVGTLTVWSFNNGFPAANGQAITLACRYIY